MDTNAVTEKVIGAAIEVHRALGPGLLESAYEECLAAELALRGIRFERQKPVPLLYKGSNIGLGFRLDLVVEDAVAVELKAVDQILPIHEAQVLTYLKLTGLQVALLLNFNVKLLPNGIRRLVLNLEE
jgi:GxxExxY protein